jgi:hypothetical protein
MTTKQQPVTLAREFSRVLTEWLTPAEMADVNAKNAAEYNPIICHSHDYCDANMAMDEAFSRAFGYSPLDDAHRDPADDGMTAENVDLINSAWDIAKALEFNADKIAAAENFARHLREAEQRRRIVLAMRRGRGAGCIRGRVSRIG